MLKEDSSKFQDWLAYTPMLYTHLVMFSASHINQINSVQWLRGFTHMKSSFKFQEGFLCISGATSRNSKSGGLEGGFSTYRSRLPAESQLDDDRLSPEIKLRSHWCFEEEINIVQQYGNDLEDTLRNNMFAISYKKQPVVNLVSTRRLLEEGIHREYAEAGCKKLEGHRLPITSIKWANLQTGSHKIFTASEDSAINQWDIEKIALQRTMKYHRESVQAITPFFDFKSSWGDGPVVRNATTTLASASTDGYIFIWDNKSQVPVNKINPKQRELYAIDCVSQNLLLSGGADGSIKLWDLRNQREYLYDTRVDKVAGHTAKIREIKVSRSDQISKGNERIPEIGRIKFSTSSDDCKIIQWQEKIQFVHEGHENPPTFDLLDNGKLCASAQLKKDVFMIWQSGVSLAQSEY